MYSCMVLFYWIREEGMNAIACSHYSSVMRWDTTPAQPGNGLDLAAAACDWSKAPGSHWKVKNLCVCLFVCVRANVFTRKFYWSSHGRCCTRMYDCQHIPLWTQLCRLLVFFLNSYFISHQITWCHCVGVKGEMEEQCCEIGLVSVQP